MEQQPSRGAVLIKDVSMEAIPLTQHKNQTLTSVPYARHQPRLAGLLIITMMALLCGCDQSVEPAVTGSVAVLAQPASTQKMMQRLALLSTSSDPMLNSFLNDQRLAVLQNLSIQDTDQNDPFRVKSRMAHEMLRAGQSEQAAELFGQLLTQVNEQANQYPKSLAIQLRKWRAISFMRWGEQSNCVALHMSQSCLFPIDNDAVHLNQQGSKAAMADYRLLLEENPQDLSSRWLYNLAAQTIGVYPEQVPESWLLAPELFASEIDIDPFINVAPQLNLNTVGLSGGSIMEDFNGDGLLDIMVSSWGLNDQMRLFINRGSAGFEETTGESGLVGIVGGLNMVQADYDNDGDIDVLVLRGAWLFDNGRHPNSLLQNDGHGFFVDVTEASGLLSFHPTQTAAWGDFDNDGWLDLFIGNEIRPNNAHPGELYRSNGDGTFSEIAQPAWIASNGFVKAVVWGDYDNDGKIDLYVSRLGQTNLLYKNLSEPGKPRFKEVAQLLGVEEPIFSFPAWFWDYDNDGWLDIFVADYSSQAYVDNQTIKTDQNAVEQIVASYLKQPVLSTPRLYRNNQGGGFERVDHQLGLNTPSLAMGANFGDIDNDGYPDMYWGTGDPSFQTLIPNRMFRNHEGKQFQDATTSAGVGHLQKGHGVSFGDMDNDGDQDIYAVMGGAYSGDVFQNALFQNPGNEHHWLTLRLQGSHANRSAIGARVHLRIDTPSGSRDIHKVVSSGGSFGANSLQQEIGLGEATSIRFIRIDWPGGETQTVEQPRMDQIMLIQQEQSEPILLGAG